MSDNVIAPSAPSSWPPARVLSLVAAIPSLVIALGLIAASGVLLLVDNSLRDSEGFFDSPSVDYRSSGYAVTSEPMRIHATGMAAHMPESIIGDVKVTAMPDEGTSTFVGIARSRDVADYLDDVEHSVITRIESTDSGSRSHFRQRGDGPPIMPPWQNDFWVAQTSGAGGQSVTWPVQSGDWTLVVMNADAQPGVHGHLRVGATMPLTGWLTALLVIGGLFFLPLGAGLLFYVASTPPTPPRQHTPTQLTKEST